MGTYVHGAGFTLTPAERQALIDKDRRNAARIFPYLGGEEVNTSPTQSFHRYVISFGKMSLPEAEQWPDLIRIVREKVKPERDKLKNNADGRRLREFWWQFGRNRPALYAAISGLERCLVNSQVSKHLFFAWQPTNRIFAHTLYVYPLSAHTAFAILQSRVHEPWARLLSSSMKNDLRYAASDCFETFPFPQRDPRTVIQALEEIGQRLYEERAQTMVTMGQGLTQTYNQLKDSECREPRIVELRELHEELDRVVLASYGWDDLEAPPFARSDPVFEQSVLTRLFELNALRAGSIPEQILL